MANRLSHHLVNEHSRGLRVVCSLLGPRYHRPFFSLSSRFPAGVPARASFFLYLRSFDIAALLPTVDDDVGLAIRLQPISLSVFSAVLLGYAVTDKGMSWRKLHFGGMLQLFKGSFSVPESQIDPSCFFFFVISQEWRNRIYTTKLSLFRMQLKWASMSLIKYRKSYNLV